MLFHTWIFLLFFLVVYGIYLPLRRTRFCTHWLLLSSYVFYGWWNVYYLILIVYSTLLDYAAVNRMARGRHRRFWLWMSILNNLALLGFFKYAHWFVETLNGLFLAMGTSVSLRLPSSVLGMDWLLPVGISFFTFQSMSYTIDFYRGKVAREPSFIRFAAFVSLFPQLVAGPIERASHLLGQLRVAPRIRSEHLADGASLFLVGLFKKLAIADYLGTYVDAVYAAPDLFNRGALVCATVAFGFQIYCDFSGYTDMARGIARLMGYNLMLNFNHPYAARDLREFWARWHISLSTWFRDYVYIPLGGNRHGATRTYVNIAAAMLISGLWHGAAWTFVVWGALHAAGRLLTLPFETLPRLQRWIPVLLRQIMVFFFVMLTWAFFRAASLAEAVEVLRGMVLRPWGLSHFPPRMWMICLGMWTYQLAMESPRLQALLQAAPVRMIAVLGMVIVLVFYTVSGGDAFIYFQF